MSGQLRILHVDKFASRAGGGAPGYMLDLVARQRERGHAVEFLATEGVIDLETRYRHLFPRRITLDPPPSGTAARVGTAATMVWSRRAAVAMAAMLDDFRPDIVHCHNLYHQLSPSVLRSVARRRVPVVMTVHDYKLVCPTYRLIDGDGRHCERCVDGGVHHVLRQRCQSGSVAQSAVLMLESGLHRRFGAYDPIATFLCPSAYMADLFRRAGLGDRARHLPYGCDVSLIEPRTGTGSGVIFGGRLSPEKGVDHLIEAVALLDDVELTICGDGPTRAVLETQANRLLGNRVRFLGHVPRVQLLDLIRAAAVVAVPSVWAENQPLMVLDAMACAVPVVSGNSPALQEQVRAGVSGLTVDPHDHIAFAEALAQFVNDPQQQRAIGASARAFVVSRNDMDAHLAVLDQLYREHIGAKFASEGKPS